MKNYKFSFPVKVNFIVDESLINIETIEDLEDIQDEYDVDLNDIIEKCDLDNLVEEIEDDYDEDEEYYYSISKEDTFLDVINDNWDYIIKKINKEYYLKDLEEYKVGLLFDYTSSNFNKDILNGDLDPIIESIELINYNIPKSEFHVNISTSRELTTEEIESLRVWLDSQTTENWGDDFSKKDLSDILNINNMSVYIIPWSLKKEVKYLK